MGQKLGSNRCPLFTMLAKQNSSMFRIVSFVKKNSKCFFLFFFSLTWDPIWRSPFSKPKNVCSSVNLKSHLAIPFNQSYMRSHLATSFILNLKKCVVDRSTWNPIWWFPLTKATWDSIWRPHSTGTKKCVVARSTWNPIWRFPLTKATWDPIWRPH